MFLHSLFFFFLPFLSYTTFFFFCFLLVLLRAFASSCSSYFVFKLLASSTCFLSAIHSYDFVLSPFLRNRCSKIDLDHRRITTERQRDQKNQNPKKGEKIKMLLFAFKVSDHVEVSIRLGFCDERFSDLREENA